MKKTIIIAEAGVNHNGNYNLAVKLAKVAKEAGADIVKFQTAIPEAVMTSYAPKAKYQKRNTSQVESQLEMSKKIHLPLDDFIGLRDYCKKIDIEFLTTAFDPISLKFVSKLGMNYLKIPSGEITNFPYLHSIGKLRKNIILSTGMSTIGDIETAIDVLEKAGTNRNKITLLHCNTEYPTRFEDVNLTAMTTIGNTFKMRIGYSDHTPGIEVPIAAVTLGATIIEKHFTIDKKMEGPDHKASLSPDELANMVKAIRNVEICLGNGIKRISNSERKNIIVARKSIVAACKIKKGDKYTEKNLTTKRPGNGLSPMFWKILIKKKAVRDFEKDELIEI